jgi:HK97 family phage major capsid protein
MYGYEEIKSNIAKLSAKLQDIDARARGEQRALTAKEAGLCAEIEAEIDHLRKSLPANAPLSLAGPGGQSTIGTGRGFRSLGEQMQAVARAASPGAAVDPRLYEIRAAAAGLNESVPSEGGFLVQQDFSTALLASAFDDAPVASRCNRIPISAGANSIKLPMVDETSRATGSRWGGVRSYWLGEAAEKTESKPKFRQIELSLKKLVGVCYATDELLQDTTALDTVLGQAFAEEIAFQTDDAIINGTGAGQPLGILTSGALVSVDKEAGQAAKTIVWENVVKMFSRMPGRNRRTACWFINQAVEPQLYSMSLAVGTGGIPVFMPAGGASAAPYASLFGRPVIPIEQAAALGTVGDIMFADMNSYVLIDKGGIKTDMSIHVQFLTDQSVFRFVYRVDGQPSWAAPLTPFKGSSTLSPWVALATRS